MSIKYFVATGFVTIFATAVTMAGCGVDSASDTEGDEVSDNAGAVTVTVDCTANSPSAFASPNYTQAFTASASTILNATDNTAFDLTGLCTAEMNRRRQQSHTLGTKTIPPYYNLYKDPNTTTNPNNIVPAYSGTAINVSATTGSSVCRLCKGVADAKAGTHSGYGMCYGISPDATGPVTNETSVGWCGFTPSATLTANAEMLACLNMFESESGAGGHKGPLVWDSPRNITCVAGIYKDPSTGALKGGLTFSYSYPPRVAAALNGENCKVSGECLSKRCSNSRCVGFASSIPVGSTTVTAGVSTCPAADSADCTTHTEDWNTTTNKSNLCFSKNLACASGVCTNSVCQKGAASSACVTGADCTSGVCTSGACQ